MRKKSTHPFACRRCDAYPKSAFFIFPATDLWLIFYPQDHLIHLHFGRATWSPTESTQQGEWLQEKFFECLDHKYPNIATWFVTVDVSRVDDSAFPSEGAKKCYRNILQHSHIDRTVFYGATTGVTFLIRMILQFSKAFHKASIVLNANMLEEEFAHWQTKQH